MVFSETAFPYFYRILRLWRTMSATAIMAISTTMIITVPLRSQR